MAIFNAGVAGNSASKPLASIGNVWSRDPYGDPLFSSFTGQDADEALASIANSSQVADDGNDPIIDPTGVEQAQWEYEKQLELLAEQRAYNSAEAQKNREWQERMSNTAYQRAVQDLEAAGLNKWLAVTGGGNGASASTPSGSSASSSAGDASQPSPYLAKSLLQFGESIISSIIKLFA